MRGVRALAAAFAAAALIAAGATRVLASPGFAAADDVTLRLPADGFAAAFTAQAAAPEPPAGYSAFALPSPGLLYKKGSTSISSGERKGSHIPVLSAERAGILLRSLTVPGWGQATLGHNGAAKTFILVEAGIWTSFVAFKIQEAMRTDSYERSARINAGIDVSDRDEEYRRIVGGFLSSEDYNRLVVYRDAANLYYDDPTQYWAYIDSHSLKGKDAWNWASLEDLGQYRAQRKDAQRADQRANTALALAVVNRLISVVHAMRIAGKEHATQRSWNFEMVPVEDGNLLAMRCGVRARF